MVLKRILLCVLFGAQILTAYSQRISVSGIKNQYLPVDSVLADRVRISDTTGIYDFHPGDKILVIQMTGAELFDELDFPNFKTRASRTVKTFKNTGKFEVLQLDEILTAGGKTYLVFTDELSNEYDDGEKIQVVRFIEAETVTVSGTLTAKDWDGITGGVVAIIGTDSVNLNADIDASDKGFRGGEVPSEDYTGGCRSDISASVLDTLYFTSSEVNRSGNKGEGIITVKWPYTKGAGFAINGGGAGNGLYSGGAGGTNVWAGGDGGQQSSSCSLALTPSWGGYGCYFLYTLSERKIVMGGGGGSGVKSATKTASAGGDGGGIVIIITGTLAGNGHSIISNGQSAGSATGSAGGGGGGGAIIIDATSYLGSLGISARGGNGGATNSNCTGSGGGGGGGALWFSGASIPASPVNVSGGAQGYVTSGCVAHSGNGGAAGDNYANLIMPLNGFLFNTIKGTDTICQGQVPGLLTASRPKGGNGVYDYSWEQSTDSIDWAAAQGSASLLSLQPPALDITTWYRRIVVSDTIADTSRVIKILVYPSISDNQVSGTDTICYGLPAAQLTGTNPSGGNNSYSYRWQTSLNLTSWSFTGATYTTNDPFDPGILTATRHYRRVVTSSAYCSDTSNNVTVTVLPSITSNAFQTSDTVICSNQGPGLLNARNPAGGDGDYAFSWQRSYSAGVWEDIPTSDLLRYDPGILNQPVQFRRIVYSGNDDACIDTSEAKIIDVLPLIAGNILDSDSDRYCAGDIPLLVGSPEPSGGAGSGTYSYKWESDAGSGWLAMGGETNKDYLPSVIFESDLSLRRIVFSGENNACADTSGSFDITVIPYITNLLDLDDQSVCWNTAPLPFSAGQASGGLNGISYEWIQNDEGSAQWVTAEGVHTGYTYSAPILQGTRYYARKAISDICTVISDTVKVLVYPSIAGNIAGSAVQYTCYDSPESIDGSLPTGGKEGDYEYLWQESSNNINWTSGAGANSAQDYLTAQLTSAKYFRRIVYSGSSAHECADTSAAVRVLLNPLPSGDVVSSSDTLCAGGTIYIRFNVNGLHGPFNVTIGNGSLTASKSGTGTATDSVSLVLASDQQIGIMSIEDDSLCYADISANTGLVSAKVYEVPVANAGPDQQVCGDNATLSAVRSINGSAGSWSSAGSAFENTADPASDVTVSAYGTAVYKWTENNWKCTDEDEVSVTFYEEPAVPEAGPDQVIEFGFVTALDAAPASAGTGKWTVSSGNGIFYDDGDAMTTVSELEYDNIFRWTVTNGVCEPQSDSVNVGVKRLLVDKVFTPNGDTKNDVFDPGIIDPEQLSIEIYNSVGVLVYSSDNYSGDNLWDGYNMNGVEVPEGTYYYVLNIRMPGRQKELQVKSFIEVIR